MQLQRQFVHTQSQRLHKILPQNFSWMHRSHQLFRFAHLFPALSVIIHDFYLVAMPIAPNETNPPLIVNPDRVLPFPVAAQCLQLVSWRRCQHAQFRRGVQLQEFSQRDALEGPKTPRMLVMKQLFGFLRGKALNHTPSILRSTLYVNRGRWRLRLKAGGDSSPATKSGNSKSSATSACSISSAAGSIGSCRERPSQTEKRRRAAALQKMHSRPRQNPPATASPQRPPPAGIPWRRRLPASVTP